MKRLLEGSLLLILGVVLGRILDGVPATAAGSGTGGGVVACSSANGDVNSDGSVNISDALTLLNHLFAGEPTVLAPLCALPSIVPFPRDDRDRRIIDNGDATVNDTLTGLMWQKDPNPNLLTWQAAGAYCANLSLGGHDDWRLPTIRELLSIYQFGGPPYDQSDPAFVANNDGDGYWTNTGCLPDPSGHAYTVDFEQNPSNGVIVRRQKDSGGLLVRAVRNAQ